MATIDDLISKIDNAELRIRITQEVARMREKRDFGLVFENHLPESTPLYGTPVRRGNIIALIQEDLKKQYRVLDVMGCKLLCERLEGKHEHLTIPKSDAVVIAQFGQPIYPYLQQIDRVCNAPDSKLWHTLIEAENYHALQLLCYLYPGQVDCIYIDPPYNTGARDWKYNNDYVDSNDRYRHSKWLSMMKRRLELARTLLNPLDSVLIVTIDEKEYLHLGLLLNETFPEARIQMVSSVINSAGVTRGDEFSRSNEYLFFIKFGRSAPAALPLNEEWRGHTKSEKREALVWNQLMRSGTGASRKDRPNMFYPLFVNKEGTKIVKIGESIPIEADRNTIKPIDGTQIVWPIRSNGEEGRWRIGRKKLESIYNKGFVRLGSFTAYGMALTYLANGEQKKVEDGVFNIIGIREDGSVIEGDMESERTFIPGTQWDIISHNATYHGTQLLNKIIGNRFPFPKSLYAVHDAIRFFVADKPNALIVDFFAGSGTTLHAVNLLNAEDCGNRRCIMVTNNEVSEQEEKELRKNGLNPGEEEWERLGIARYVTWPRTVCSIKGQNVKGEPLRGNYISDVVRPMAEGFDTNAVYFKLGFLDKEEVELARQFRELLPLLWMKAGAVGGCPTLAGDDIPDMLVLPENRMAILNEESCYNEFEKYMKENKEIETIFIVTDSDQAFQEMQKPFRWARCTQLYKDYLRTFSINYEK